ncbi:envelope stress sensor histidine kinase CpxA [Vibrio tritonius]|uniref:envelope stress sensor histidine kinase CpxA n=1 Tax=Vibrio tritonius TaxID=1435069 RepID=UPI00315C787F
MTLPKLNSLYGRIFAIFWLTLAIIVVGVVIFPNMDPRKSRHIPPEMFQHMIDSRDMLMGRFSDVDDLNWILHQMRERPGPRGPRDKHRPDFFITTLDGNILSPQIRPEFKYRALKNFTSIAEFSEKPQQKAYGKYQIAGPFPIILAKQQLLLFVGVDFEGPPPFLIQLFDHPLQLLLLVMVVSTPFLLWLAWALSQPAQRFAKAADRVAQGNFVVDPELEKGPSEFRSAGHSFNQMVGAVNAMISGQQRLLSDISHELRSPLTRLRMATGLAARKQGESVELERIDTEAQRLEQMIGELLELSRMQTDSHMSREVQPLSSLWEELLSDAQFEAEQLNKVLRYDDIPDVRISGNPKLLMSALENIVRNAIKYGKDVVDVAFVVNQQKLMVTIQDNGEGVPDTELEQIFRPFYRVSTARDRSTGGTGLGLAITESAIRQHSGSIKASRSSLGGLQVQFTLPLQG